MKLIKAHVTNYRNIIDSNEVDIVETTCLVGKNEAGKTAFLKALEGLRSTDQNFTKYNKIEDYPRRYYANYNERHPDGEAVVIETTWEMSPEDNAVIEEELGEGVLTDNYVEITKSYGKTSSTWNIPLDEEKVLSNLIKRLGLVKEDKSILSGVKTTVEASRALEKNEKKSEKLNELLTLIGKFRDKSAQLRAIDILNVRTPKFLYFSHYDRMNGEISINQLNKDKESPNGIKVGDQIFLDFLEYASTNLDELYQTKRFEELNAKCEAAANRITDQIFEYWTQNDELKIQVRLSEGQPADPPPFNEGPVARARVENNLHRVSVPFSERSAGFVWFFSFLVKFAQIKSQYGNVIILLDEPGLTLHGTAQKDLLRYIKEELEPNHQVIYTTHSPFMVPPHDLQSVRTVEDVVIKDERDRKKSIGTKIRADILTTDPQTNFPVFGAMGYEVTQTLIIGVNTLLVEGPSDILYLQAFSNELKKRDKTYLNPNWAICPSGGIDKVLPFVRLFSGNKLNVAVLTDFERGQRRKLDDLYKSELLEKERITLATEITGKSEADTEDFFEPELYVDLLNKTYDLTGVHLLTVEKLFDADPDTERLVKKAEAYFRVLPPDSYPEFNHFEPALYLLQHPEIISGDDEKITTTLSRFEDAFNRINKFI